MAWNYSNTSVETTLSAGIGPSDTSIALASTSGLPASYPYTLVVDYGEANVEVVDVTGLSGPNLTVTRGQDGTAAQSHSAGAVVVHGAVARDLREPQQHIAAPTDVHGVGASSSVVGTATTQTLSNKTISGLSNTLSNVPASSVTGTFEDMIVGASTLTATPLEIQSDPSQVADLIVVKDGAGVPFLTLSAGGTLHATVGSGQFDAGLVVERGTEADYALVAKGSADTSYRLRIGADGTFTFGGGSTAGDTNLYRSAANTLKTDDALTVAGVLTPSAGISSGGFIDAASQVTVFRSTATDAAFRAYVTGDPEKRVIVRTDGQILWGSGAAAGDTNLYRSAADTLKTDDSFQVAGNLTVSGTISGTVNATQVLVRHSGAQSIASGGVGQTVTFDTEDVDTASMWSSGSNVTVPSAGTYLLVASGYWSAAAGGSRQLSFKVNGSEIAGMKASGVNEAQPICATAEVKLAASDVVTLLAYQTSGAALNLNTTRFSVRRTG